MYLPYMEDEKFVKEVEIILNKIELTANCAKKHCTVMYTSFPK